jgi:protein NRD1
MEKARQAGQTVSPSAPEGTYASGIQKVTDVLPTLMNELIQSAPENQRDKISKLLDIWERGQTFPLDKLRGFKQKLNSLQTCKLAPDASHPFLTTCSIYSSWEPTK